MWVCARARTMPPSCVCACVRLGRVKRVRARPSRAGGHAPTRVGVGGVALEGWLRTCTLAKTRACVHARTHTNTHMDTHTHTCMCVCVHVHVHVCTCVCVCVCTLARERDTRT